MARRGGSSAQNKLQQDDVGELLHSALSGSTRTEIIDQIVKPGDLRESLRRLRTSMRSHTFRTASGRLLLDGVVEALDRPTRREGFYVLHAWDPDRQRFTSETNAVLTLDYLVRTGLRPGADRQVLAVLLDCYFLYVAALMVMRAWDQVDPNLAMDQVTSLLGHLQGPAGSGHRFVDDAETLLLLATSQYQPDEGAYDRLLERVRMLDDEHRTNLAAVGAANLGSHLRWGFQFMYRMDPERMRADNVVDYPWLLFCLATLMRRYEGAAPDGERRARLVESMLNGLSADPSAFVGPRPACLAGHGEEHSYLRERLATYATALRKDWELFTPYGKSYSPLAFQFNFLHNTLVAKLATSLRHQTAPNLSLNDLFRGESASGPRVSPRELFARMLMDFAAADPARRGTRGPILTVYDPADARRSFDATIRSLEQAT